MSIFYFFQQLGVFVPIHWAVIPKTRNSATQTHIDLIELFQTQFSNLSINSLVADREHKVSAKLIYK